MDWPEDVLENCFTRLKGFYDQIRRKPDLETDEEQAETVIVLSALLFALETLSAVASELGHKRVVQAAVLCRPFYELSAKVCWASRESGGWRAIEKESLRDVVRWFDNATKIPSFLGTADDYIAQQRARLKALGSQRRVPQMKGILQKVYQHDGLATKEAAKQTKFAYQIYREFSLFEHGNVQVVGPGLSRGRVAQNAVLLCIFATYLLAAAAVCFVADNVDHGNSLIKKQAERTLSLYPECDIGRFAFFDED